MREKSIIALFMIVIIILGMKKPTNNAEILDEHTANARTTETTAAAVVEIETVTQKIIVPEEQKRKPETSEDKRALEFMQSDLGEWIITYSYKKGADPFLIFAIAERESDFNPECIGDNGESIGLMQVQRKWNIERMERLEVESLQNPKECVIVAIDILLEYEEKNKDLYFVLMAYNGGETYAQKYYAQKPSEYAVEITERATALCEFYEGATE